LESPTIVHGNRIHLFGASGSGTTTLGQEVARRLELPLLDVDSYFWKDTDPPFTEKTSPENRIAAIELDLEGSDSWVISGSMCGWGDPLMPRFSLAVFLAIDPTIRLQRLATREHARFGNRIEPGGDMYEIHRDFMEWAEGYDTARLDMRSLAVHELWLRRLDCPLLRLDGASPIDDLATTIIGQAN
jgi:adenylate kinase family enzyme